MVAYWKQKRDEVDNELCHQLHNVIAGLEDLETTTPSHFDSITGLPNCLTARTAINWLHKLGYKWVDIKKGLYKDGHDREDVVEYRQTKFLPQLATLQPSLKEWTLNDNDTFTPVSLEFNGQLRVTVTHDECTFNANDCRHQQWVEEGGMPLQSKSRGKGIMVSDFLTPIGRLQVPSTVSDNELPTGRRFATEILECGGDIWWNCADLIKQVVEHTIPIFEVAYPGCQAVFFFDNATGHSAYATNALRASSMNLTPGGKQPTMRDGFFDTIAGQQLQRMNFAFDDTSVPRLWRGQPKGLKRVLEERGLWRNGLLLKCKYTGLDGKKHDSKIGDCIRLRQGLCCARSLMAIQPDFLQQKGLLQEAIEKRGHMVLFYPKFHCELNFIEYYWGAAKQYARKNCGYSIVALRVIVPQALESVSPALIWKYWHKTQRIMAGYREGYIYGSNAFKTIYKSHRRVSESKKVT